MPSFHTNPLTAVFDWNVFDFAFDIYDETPFFNKIVVARAYRQVQRGQAISLYANVQYNSLYQNRDFDLATPPQIQIYNPDDTILLAFFDMNFAGTAGHYNYQHQVEASDQLGIYTAQFMAVNGTMTALTEKLNIFKAVS
jgi:hypothetical protein